jgi:hypothetical protein
VCTAFTSLRKGTGGGLLQTPYRILLFYIKDIELLEERCSVAVSSGGVGIVVFINLQASKSLDDSD